MSTIELLAAPPSVPTQQAPPEASVAQPRTERHDWVFVGYRGFSADKRNAPPHTLYVANADEVASAVHAYVARDKAAEQYPYILLTPSLATAFVEQATAALVANVRFEPLTLEDGDEPMRGCEPVILDVIWDVGLDLRALDAHEAEMTDKVNQQNHAEYSATRVAKIEAGLTNVNALTSRQLRTLVVWIDWQEYHWKASGVTRHGITVGESVTRTHHHDLQRRLHPAEELQGDGWTIVIHDAETDLYTTPSGVGFVPSRQYYKLRSQLENGEILPQHVHEFMDFVNEYHDERNEDCDAVPSNRAVAAFLKERGIGERGRAARIARSAAKLFTDPALLQPPTAVLPYLAWPGRLTVLAAREKDGKSTLVGSGVGALTRGVSWLGQPTVAGNVLWLHEEAERDVIARLHRFGADLQKVFLLHLPLGDVERDLTANIDAHKPVLIVIDSLVRFAGSAVTQDTSAAQWQAVLTPLLTNAHKSNIAFLVLHHAQKGSGEYRDSTEIGASCDMLIQMPKGLQGNRQTLEARGRIVGIEPYTVTVALTESVHHVVGDAVAGSTRSLTEHQTRALAALRTLVPNPEAPPVGISAWEQQAGLPSTTFDRVRESLVDGGHVERIGEKGGRGQRFRPKAT